jgi:hypothetical protein
VGGNSFIITPPFSPSAIWVTSGGTLRPASTASIFLPADHLGRDR